LKTRSVDTPAWGGILFVRLCAAKPAVLRSVPGSGGVGLGPFHPVNGSNGSYFKKELWRSSAIKRAVFEKGASRLDGGIPSELLSRKRGGGLSDGAGLDSRMILACAPPRRRRLPLLIRSAAWIGGLRGRDHLAPDRASLPAENTKRFPWIMIVPATTFRA